jgi:hypothetical protein
MGIIILENLMMDMKMVKEFYMIKTVKLNMTVVIIVVKNKEMEN